MIIISCAPTYGIKKWDNYALVRSENNPMIYPEMTGLEGRLGENINGPSVIKVPKWIKNPKGKYYMYFANHHGKYIRMAFSDSPTGPWIIYKPGVLHLDKTQAVRHIASPDVLIDEETKSIRMYFHGPTPNKGGQKTFLSRSMDGLNFTVSPTVLGPSYFRVFKYDGYYYALVTGTFYRSKDGMSPFEKGVTILPRLRHSAVTLVNDELIILYSQKGDMPERILKSTVKLKGYWENWKASAVEEVLKPEFRYEGSELPIVKSVKGFAKERMHELRDPALLIDKSDIYLYYSIAGEAGIAVAKFVNNKSIK